MVAIHEAHCPASAIIYVCMYVCIYIYIYIHTQLIVNKFIVQQFIVNKFASLGGGITDLGRNYTPSDSSLLVINLLCMCIYIYIYIYMYIHIYIYIYNICNPVTTPSNQDLARYNPDHSRPPIIIIM